MHLYYSDHFELPLPLNHRFPMDKYRRLRHRIATSELHRDDPLLIPPAASDEQLATLLKLTERYCVIFQTLRTPPQLSATVQRSAA